MRQHPRARAALVGALLAGVALAGCGGRGGGDATSADSQTVTLESAGDARSYVLHEPASDPGGPLPLVLVLHGGFGSAEQAEEAYGWDARADDAGFVVAYPEGLGKAWAVGGGCCGDPGDDGVDDVAFLEAVVADVGDRVQVDPDRVYATGMSNGALMSYRLACDSDLFAAVGPVAGTLLGDCPDPRQVSLLHIHGTADENVPIDGGAGNGRAAIDGPPVEDAVQIWRTADGCAPPTTSTDGAVTTSDATCPDGREVELVTVDGAGHQWPGSVSYPGRERLLGTDPPSEDLDATAVLWDFFAAHPRAG